MSEDRLDQLNSTELANLDPKLQIYTAVQKLITEHADDFVVPIRYVEPDSKELGAFVYFTTPDGIRYKLGVNRQIKSGGLVEERIYVTGKVDNKRQHYRLDIYWGDPLSHDNPALISSQPHDINGEPAYLLDLRGENTLQAEDALRLMGNAADFKSSPNDASASLSSLIDEPTLRLTEVLARNPHFKALHASGKQPDTKQ